jgi:beta-phosphoglucomutase-like phosphatase (HAD superfamily)
MTNSIVFDMDGVLFDSERIYYRAWVEAGRKLNLPEIDECVTHCVGRNGSDIREYLLDKFGPSFRVDDFVEDIKEEFRKNRSAEACL